MSGRELIIYISENKLEDVNIFDKEFLRFMPTIEVVAVIFNVGIATVEAWVKNGWLKTIEFDGQKYITPDSLDKFGKEMGYKEAKNA